MNPHLSFNGEREQAFRFYEKCLGGKITMMMKAGVAGTELSGVFGEGGRCRS
jgi:uncharacterized glyoxalase superfamily protein PhnB